ncbi:MAG: hypothetical protein FJW35_18490 [Acidobacteria bacterium]|nr:hypothetical protein [Acidobacteriota bacterium]
MTGHAPLPDRSRLRPRPAGPEAGFSLTEALISSVMLLVLALAAVDSMTAVQRVAALQHDFHGALESAVICSDVLERVTRQCGNDPHEAGIEAFSLLGGGAVRLRSDTTGTSAPDRGDPDGDTDDSYEDIIIRRNPAADTIEVTTVRGGLQTIAENITELGIAFLDAAGSTTASCSGATRARITIGQASGPYGGAGVRLSTDVHMTAHP